MKYYYNLMSQPSRALYIFLKFNQIPAEFINIDLQNGEHLSDEYRSINRFQKVPCIVTDDGFQLSESIAIFRYLMKTNPEIAEFWYPKDPRARARVDEYLEWQHNNTRLGCAISFQIRKNIGPFSFQSSDGEKPALQIFELLMEMTLQNIENNWVGDKKFIASNEISFADLLAVCEIEQTRAAGYNVFEGRLKLKEWYERVRGKLNPFYDEANVIVDKVAKRAAKL
jgi:glutathione S-transferase